jgi:hypothetical protein
MPVDKSNPEFWDQSTGNALGEDITGVATDTEYSILELEVPRHSIDVYNQMQTAVRVFVVDQPLYDNFVMDFAGNFDWTPGGACTTWLPANYPDKPWLVVNRISSEAHGDRDLSCGWDSDGIPIVNNGLRVVVEYVTRRYLTYDDDPDTIPQGTAVELKVDFGAQALLLDQNGLSWEGPNGSYQPVLPTTQVGSFEPLLVLDCVWQWVPLPPWSAIAALVGCVNYYPLFGFPAETIMFVGCHVDMAFQTMSNLTMWRLHYKFQVRQVGAATESGDATGTGAGSNAGQGNYYGWNHFLNPHPKDASGNPLSGIVYQRIVNTADKSYLFMTVDLRDLFTIGTSYSFNAHDDVIENSTEAISNVTLVDNDPVLLN